MTVLLPDTFHFTQSNLQDYVDCQRRFQLRYVNAQAWPGVEAEPFLDHEDFLERGARFHRLVERHQLGIDPALIEAGIESEDTLGWWRAYLDFDLLHDLEGVRYPEFAVVADLEGFRLAATYDLLVDVPDDRLVIFDWKTYRRFPGRRFLAERVQTRLYMCLAVLAGEQLVGRSVGPNQLSMVYWVVSQPGFPEVFEYSGAQFERDRAYLLRLLREIVSSGGGVWPLVGDDALCRFCTFRSLCGRGRFGGELEELSMDVDNIALVGFDLGDVEEVGF